MNRALYYLFKIIALISLVLRNRSFSMFLMTIAHKFNNVTFVGKPRYIHPSAVLDASTTLEIGENVVISSGVLILTHDYSYTVGLAAINERPDKDIAIIGMVKIGEGTFVGANSTILPGTIIGDYVIIGAGSIVKGNVPSFSIVAGNPAKFIVDTRDWARIKKIKLMEKMTSKY